MLSFKPDRRLDILKKLFPTLEESELKAAVDKIDSNILEMLLKAKAQRPHRERAG